MPYDPQTSYRGDQYLFQGIAGLGKSVGDAIDEHKKKAEEIAAKASYNDAIISHAAKYNLIGQEDVNKYNEMSGSAKMNYAGGLAANIAQDWQRKMFADEQAQKKQQMALQLQIARIHAAGGADGAPFAPSDSDRAAAARAGGELVPTGKGTYHFAPYPDKAGGADATQVDPFVDPVTKQPVPGMGIVRKTGAIGYFGGLQGGGVQIEADPKSGVQFYRDAKGVPHPLTPQNLEAGKTYLTQQKKEAKAAADAANPGIVNKALAAVGLQKAGAAPAAAAAPVGVAGYIPGRVYAGKTYKGGDPNDPNNWQ